MFGGFHAIERESGLDVAVEVMDFFSTYRAGSCTWEFMPLDCTRRFLRVKEREARVPCHDGGTARHHVELGDIMPQPLLRSAPVLFPDKLTVRARPRRLVIQRPLGKPPTFQSPDDASPESWLYCLCVCDSHRRLPAGQAG